MNEYVYVYLFIGLFGIALLSILGLTVKKSRMPTPEEKARLLEESVRHYENEERTLSIDNVRDIIRDTPTASKDFWVCEYCNSRVNIVDEICFYCGSPRKKTEGEGFIS